MGKLSKKDIALLKRTVEIAKDAKEKGNQPFGALLTDEEGNILLEEGSTSKDGGEASHAVTILLLKAARLFLPEFLFSCSVYSNVEPCAMCTSCLYWTNVGRLVYGASKKEYTSGPLLSISPREVIEKGEKKIEVLGPAEDEELLSMINDGIRGLS